MTCICRITTDASAMCVYLTTLMLLRLLQRQTSPSDPELHGPGKAHQSLATLVREDATLTHSAPFVVQYLGCHSIPHRCSPSAQFVTPRREP